MTSDVDGRDQDADDGPTPQQAYETVLRAVRHHTGDDDTKLSAAVSERGLRTVCCANGPLDPQTFKGAVDRALENDDLFCYKGSTGDYHFVLREDGALEAWVQQFEGARHPESATAILNGFLEAVADADDLDRQRLIGTANRVKQSLQEGHDD